MPTSTYVPLASTTLSSPTSIVSFTSIPQTYKEIVFSISAFATSSSQSFQMYYNNDTGSNYFWGFTSGGGGSRIHSENNSSSFILWPNSVIPAWDADNAGYEIFIPDYAETSKCKTFVGQGFTLGSSSQTTGVYYLTNAITGVYFKAGTANFATGSTFNLWGIDG